MLLGACNSSGSDQTAAVNAAAPSNIVPVASYLVTLAPGEKAVEPLTLGDDTPAPAITRFVLGTDIGFAATAGFNSNASVRSVAGLLASTDIVDPPSQGSASYEGVYNIIEVRNVEVRADGTSSISPRLLGGRAVIDVDFDKNTLLGYSDGSPILQVKGTFSGKKLKGTAIYRAPDDNSIVGEMRGFVGAKNVVGATHGVSGDKRRAFSGGFVASISE